MNERESAESMYVTVSMAEVLLSQNLVQEAKRVISKLAIIEPHNPRVKVLEERLAEMLKPLPLKDPTPISPLGVDRVSLCLRDTGMDVEWEMTEAGLNMAKRFVRYSGRCIIRLFTAAMGNRGIRTQIRDVEIDSLIGRTVLLGLPRPAVHIAAVGFLANTGVFISSAQSSSLKVLT